MLDKKKQLFTSWSLEGLQLKPSTSASLMNFLPHFVPVSLTSLGEPQCSQVAPPPSDEAFVAVVLSPGEHVQSGV